MPPVFSPVWKTISSRRLVICPLPLLKRRISLLCCGLSRIKAFWKSRPEPGSNSATSCAMPFSGAYRKQSGAASGWRCRLTRKEPLPRVTAGAVAELLGRIGDYQQGRELTRLAVVLTLHLFIRSSELRFARWSRSISGTKSGPSPPPARQSTKYGFRGVAQKYVPRISCRSPARRLPF